MKKVIVLTILSLMLLTTEENDCDPFKTSSETCYKANPNGKYCIYYNYDDGGVCLEVVNKDKCQYDPSKGCVIKPGEVEPDLQVCGMVPGDNADEESCGFVPASCWNYENSKDKCLSLGICGYDEKREYNRCFSVGLDGNCKFENNKCTLDSNQKICEMIEEEGNMYCKERDIKCSDLDQDSSSCLNADLQDGTKKCSYNSSRSSGNKCFEVSVKEGCTYDNENILCKGDYSSSGKICDLDYSENPATCQKRNIQCSDFNGDESKCQSAKLPDKSKECSYNSDKCVEKEIKAECIFDEANTKCTSTLSSKINCKLNEDNNGCTEKSVECSDFTNQNDCNDAIISDSNKKCKYESGQCSESLKECSDFYNENQCVRYKPQNALAKCVWSKECKEKTCKTTSTENCGSFKPNDSSKQCALNQDKTECEEIRKPQEANSNGAKSLRLLLSIISLLIIL